MGESENIKNYEEIELKDTIDLMNSADYKDRFKAEYAQTLIRHNKLQDMITKFQNGTLEFTPTCPIGLLIEQAVHMKDYLMDLEDRAEIEDIDLKFI